MKTLALLSLLSLLSGCVEPMRIQGPDHIAVKTGVSWELIEGFNTKTKPECSMTMDWNL